MQRLLSLLFITSLFAAASSPGSLAGDAWVLLGKTDDVGMFYDPSSVRLIGDVAEVRSLNDFRVPRIYGKREAYSQVVLQQIRCSERVNHPLEITAYEGHGGKGGVIASAKNSEGEEMRIAPDSFGERLAERACKK